MGSLIQMPQDWIPLVQRQFVVPIERIPGRSLISLAIRLAMATKKALKKAIQLITLNVMLGSDYRIAINSIRERY